MKKLLKVDKINEILEDNNTVNSLTKIQDTEKILDLKKIKEVNIRQTKIIQVPTKMISKKEKNPRIPKDQDQTRKVPNMTQTGKIMTMNHQTKDTKVLITM